MKVAGINTVEAIFNSVKGDMSRVIGVITPTFEEVYKNIEALDTKKENAFIKITKAEFEALSEEDKEANNYIVTDDNAKNIVYEFVTADDVNSWFD